jgi:Flp pilus assembly protein TadG
MDQENTKDARGRSRRKRERGQAMVELALSLPVIVSLLLGLVEIGNGVNAYLTVLSAARDAARLAAQGGATETAMLNLVDKETERLSTDIPTGSKNCTPGAAGVCINGITDTYQVASVNAVKVKVCYNHPLIIGLPGVLPNPMQICSATTMRIASS